ncbi:hypothetical protein LTR05_004220 [Lithohypha guttulata]|uniref:Uncharacterized protein n=1 Tax=Lithohypha guttulata TaxID=1690604 RepID=A0AAN7T3I8_9EURO|nr:hypothetical protein LTR05_004220 [Lithohypha guttulata]
MQLRKTIKRPGRFDEEVFEAGHADVTMTTGMPSEDYTVPRRLVTEPAFLPTAAAFPTVSLSGAPESPSRKNWLAEAIQKGNETRSVDPALFSEGSEGDDDGEDGYTSQQNSPDVDTSRYSNISLEMETSPVRSDENHNASNVTWSMLEPSIQLYIFESLLVSLKRANTVAEVLALDAEQLENVAYLRNLRHIHPMSTDLLWKHCAKRGTGATTGVYDGSAPPVEPEILRQYMKYFTFAEQLSTASEPQRLLGLHFLRKRGIDGDFVDALLRNQQGIWSRPPEQASIGSKDVGDHAHFHETTFRDENTVQGDLRETFLSKPLLDISAAVPHLRFSLDTVGSEGEISSTAQSHQTGTYGPGAKAAPDTTVFAAEDPERRASQTMHQPTTNSAKDGSTNTTADTGWVCLLMHLITAFDAQNELILKKVADMPLSNQDRAILLEASKAQCEKNILKAFREKITEYSRVFSRSITQENALKASAASGKDLPVQFDGRAGEAAVALQSTLAGIADDDTIGVRHVEGVKHKDILSSIVSTKSPTSTHDGSTGRRKVVGFSDNMTVARRLKLTTRKRLENTAGLENDGMLETSRRATPPEQKSPIAPPWSPLVDLDFSDREDLQLPPPPLRPKQPYSNLATSNLRSSTPWKSRAVSTAQPQQPPLDQPNVQTQEQSKPERLKIKFRVAPSQPPSRSSLLANDTASFGDTDISDRSR